MDRKTAFALITALMVFAANGASTRGSKFSDASLAPQKGIVGKPFRFQLIGKPTAGAPPQGFKMESGQLPPGLTMSKRGLILGRPTTAGEFKFWCDTFDEEMPRGGRHSQHLLTITIDPAPPAAPGDKPDTAPVRADWEKPGWTLFYGDEFDGLNLDDGKKLDDCHWVPAYQGTMPANFAVENGALHVRIGRNSPGPQVEPAARPDRPGRVSSVETQWKFMQRYGFFETRARMPKGSGVMAAIWLSPALAYEKLKSDGGTRESEKEAIDIDIFKYMGRSGKSGDVAAHWGRRPGDESDGRRVELGFDPGDDFHVYGLEWNEKELVWYVDGKEVHRSDKAPHTPMFVRLSVFEDAKGKYGEVDESVGYPREMEVDWVRVYEREGG